MPLFVLGSLFVDWIDGIKPDLTVVFMPSMEPILLSLVTILFHNSTAHMAETRDC